MNIGEFFISLGFQGDTKELKKTIKELEQAEKKTEILKKREQELAQATTDEQKALIKKNYAQKEEIAGLKDAVNKRNQNITSIKNFIGTTFKMVTAVTGAVTALDRMGNALLKNNQAYMTFNRSSGYSINRLNQLSTVSQLSGMNITPEQVMNDVQNLQQRFFKMGLTGEGSGIFQMLGKNPMGSDPFQFFDYLRKRTKGMSAPQITYTLDELGLSREYVNTLMLTDKAYANLKKKSKELNLSAADRVKLGQLTERQQENNLRFQKAYQQLLIQILPTVIQIMEGVSKFLNNLTSSKPALDAIFKLFKDGVIAFATMELLSGKLVKNLLKLTGINLFGGLAGGAVAGGAGAGIAKTAGGAVAGGILGRFATKQGLKGLGRTALGAVNPILGAGMLAWLAWDIWNAGKEIKNALTGTAENIEEANENLNPDELFRQTAPSTAYNNNINSRMINNFYNNPHPAGQVSAEMSALINRYLATGIR